jgi:hypothetical protein
LTSPALFPDDQEIKNKENQLARKRAVVARLAAIPGICTGRDLIEPKLFAFTEPANVARHVTQDRALDSNPLPVSKHRQERHRELVVQLPLFPGRPMGKTLEEIFGTPDYPYGRDAIMPPGTYGGEPL